MNVLQSSIHHPNCLPCNTTLCSYLDNFVVADGAVSAFCMRERRRKECKLENCTKLNTLNFQQLTFAKSILVLIVL